jgi:hypothetical protein
LKELLPEHGTRREQLAGWVTHPENVFFARATVNRIWALLFGRPMVEPLDDLNSAGKALPALQILADDFAKHNFDVRRLVKVIVTTEAFRRDSASDQEVTETHERLLTVFPMTRLRPEQVAGSVIQAASVETLDQDSHVFVQLLRFNQEREFVQRYGDTGDDEFDGRGGTIPQRLLLMNGDLVHERTKEDLGNASAQIASLALNDDKAVELAYLTLLSRRPTSEEAAHFTKKLAATKGHERSQHLEDLCWALINSTEFSWNHCVDVVPRSRRSEPHFLGTTSSGQTLPRCVH